MSTEAPSAENRLAAIERRLEREHRARLEAERIAEETTAELYESQRELGLIGEISHRSNLAGGFDEAIRVTLETVCAHTRWEVGHAYVLDPERHDLRPTDIWHINASADFETLIEKTMRTRFELGNGLPGRVAAGEAPVCIPDVKHDPGFIRAIDSDLEIRGALGFPALVDDRVFAVLEFFSVAVMHEHDRFSAMMATIGSQLGPVLERILVREEVERNNRRLEEANEELTRMQRLIEDLLVYSRVGRSELRTREVELEAVIERVRRAYGEAIAEADAEVASVGPLPAVEGDPGELERLLSNLVSNAIKFRGERAPRIVISAERRPEGRVEVRVADDGISLWSRGGGVSSSRENPRIRRSMHLQRA